MEFHRYLLFLLCCLFTAVPCGEQPLPFEAKPPAAISQVEAEPPTDWVEPPTGHRVVRLSREPWTSSFYFHQNAYTKSGDRLVVSTRQGLATIDLRARNIEHLVEGWSTGVVVGKKTRQVFYRKGNVLYATHVDTRATREITRLPPEIRGGSGLAVNAEETLLAGSYVEGSQRLMDEPAAQGPAQVPRQRPGSLESRWAAHLPMRLFTVNIKTGEVATFHPSTDWLNHVQFSPTDARLLLFCHEGPWHKVDRIWTIRTDGTGLRKIHTRTMDMEIAGHEFFSADGKLIWYDLQTRKEKSSGLPEWFSPLAGISVTRWRRSTGQCTTMRRPTASSSPATAADRTALLPRETALGSIFTHRRTAY